MIARQIAHSLRRAAALAALGILFAASVALAEETRLETEDYLIPAADPGIELFIRNKHPAGMTSFAADRILLFVHGATYPAETAFDLKLGGFSWMDYIAERGFDVFLVDLPGYGKSTRPAEMDQPADKNPPLINTETAVKNVGAVVDMILAKRHVAKLDLIGWSWGTTIMGTYAARNSAKVNRLVLYAPVWIAEGASPFPPNIPAYRLVTKEAALKRWLTGVPEAKQGDLTGQPGGHDLDGHARAALQVPCSEHRPHGARAQLLFDGEWPDLLAC